MKKYAFLVYHAQYEDFLKKVRDIGVLHIKEKPEGIAENDLLRDKMMLSSRLTKSIQAAMNYVPDKELADSTNEQIDGLALLDAFDAQRNSIEHGEQELGNLQREADRMQVWGDYSIERLEQLKHAGIKLQFYSCSSSKFKQEWIDKYNAMEVDTVGSTLYFVAMNTPADFEADRVILNKQNYSELVAQVKEQEKSIERMKEELNLWCVAHINDLRQYNDSINDQIDWQKVELYTESAAENKVMLLEGFCPEESQAILNEQLDEMGIYYEESNPNISEVIPIKLKNNSYAKLFEPITKLFSLPNYSELDLTPFLAPFFMLFFGLCLGDGGYGLIILLVATIVKPRLKESMKPFASLFQILGGMTIIVGILTGSFFGIALDTVTWPWLANVKHLFLTQGNYGSKLGGYNPMMVLAIVIGLIQIFYGMALNAAKITKQHGFKYCLSNIGWIVALLGSAALFGLPLLGVNIPVVVNYIGYVIIGVAVLLILFYNSPDSYKKPIKGIVGNVGGALWHTYNMATGLLGDTLSYIRLFALGLTGSILGGVFNNLSLELSSSLPIGVNWLVMLIILLFGHSINFGLCLIGAFVHPLRLTFVEFYKNAGFDGGGKAYSPFHQRNKA